MTNTTCSVTDLRKQLFSNGYAPLPNFDKACFFPNWPNLEITDSEIERWERRYSRFTATGIRIENGLAAIDLDIDDPIAEDILEAWDNAIPGLDAAPLRHSGGNKFALFVRTDEPFSRIHSRRWLRDGVAEDDWVGMVEVFGGASPRQFGAFGPHTIDEHGEVLRSYQWEDDASLLTIPLVDLPLLSKEQFFDLVDIAETLLAERGFSPVKLSKTGETAPERVFDLVGDRFETQAFGVVTKAQLHELAATHDRVYLSASWLDGPVAKNPRRCLATVTQTGALAIWDSMTAMTHLEPDNDPGTKTRDFDLDRASEMLRELEVRERQKLGKRDDAYEASAKLLETYAFCPNMKNGVVPIWANKIAEGMSMASFRTMMQPWVEEEVGPRGGIRKVHPVDLWASSSRRVTVEGLRLRPDKPRPTYEEDGKLWINTYAPPQHSGTGSVSLWLEYMESLLPDATEREWFIDWLAHKYARPWVPGPGVVMVARRFGTGRGTLGAILKQLFGGPYVRQVPFSIVSGQSYQSQYTEWLAESLLVLVNESSETGGGSTYATKRDTYERLKELIEPRAEERYIVMKSAPSFMGFSYASFLIATNHVDALPIPADDRRLAVLTNGEPREEAFWDRLNAWKDEPGNIAALADWLLARGWRDYSPYVAPPMFEAKSLMVDANQSELDDRLEEVLGSLVGECFTIQQIVNLVGDDHDARSAFPRQWEQVVKRLIQSRCYRVGVRNGRNWTTMVEGRRYAVYTTDAHKAAFWTDAPAPNLRDNVLKNGRLSSVGSVAALKVLQGGKQS